jgi:hypothetical protein
VKSQLRVARSNVLARAVTDVSGKDRVAMARPERFELPTSWFVARRSIQLSYGRVLKDFSAGWTG